MKKLALLILLGASLSACSNHNVSTQFHGQIGLAVAPTSIANNSSTNAGPTVAVSGGPNALGVLVPTTTGVVARIQNGLESHVSPNSGNFKKGLTQVVTNLPRAANVNNATGFDQVELLAYSACSDLTTGGTPLMQSVYNVNPSATVTTNQAALIAAGIRMLDQHAAGLASQGPANSQLTTIFTNLVTSESADTSTTVFMTVCIAANTAGAAMLGL